MLDMKKLWTLFSVSLAVVTLNSCTTLGCMDETAENYKANATEDNGECLYINGCMDATAVNYNPEATKDDGTCIADTTGEIVFWTDGKYYGSAIDVSITKEVSGTITGGGQFKEELEIRTIHGSNPGCNVARQTFTAPPGTYKYTASSSDFYNEEWEGEVTVALGQCKNQLLKSIPDIKYTATYDSYQGGTDNNEIYIVNKCNYEYRVYAYTSAGYEVNVAGNSTGRIRNLSDDGDWKIRISKVTKERGSGNCEGYTTDDIIGVNFQSGLVYKIVIGE